MPQIGDGEELDICESWDLAAKKLLGKLWKVSSAYIFHKPVDPEELDIPDYFEVIKTPMDFSTIRNKLNSNIYRGGVQEFIDDVNLTFDNCLKYNGDDSSVGKMCKNVREDFQRLY